MLKRLLFSFILTCLATISFAQITSVGILGTATENGWDADTNMVQDPMNPDIWTISLTLTTGAAKFRADDAWDVNWGDTAFPNGVGTQNGPDIPIEGGPMDITLNTATGEYTFVSTAPGIDSIGIIGTATELGNFDEDLDMIQDSAASWVWRLELPLSVGAVKFRANNLWTQNWGGTDFPSGVGIQGAGNIPIDTAGLYLVTFNTASFEYRFEPQTVVYTSIGIIGSATPGGTAMDTDLEQNPVNPSQWSANMMLVDGTARFRADDMDEVNWGGGDFPSGTGEQDGPDIPVTAGEYNVRFNSSSGEYSFDPPINIFNSIGIIGTGVGSSGDQDIDMFQSIANPDQWSAQLHFTNGEIKFRANDNWDVNWGDDGFPTGTGVQDGPDIPTFEGDWEVLFNATTGVYSFTPVSIGIIGTATPGLWDTDQDMSASSSEANLWSINIELVDGEAKFRQDNDWPINWGADTWPTGSGTQDGPNIPVTAGTYGVTLNTGTGDYVFGDPLSNETLLNPNTVNLFPNPVAETLTVVIDAEVLQQDVMLMLMDITGKIISVQKFDHLMNHQIDVSNFANGMYILQLSTDKYIVGKRFNVSK